MKTVQSLITAAMIVLCSGSTAWPAAYVTADRLWPGGVVPYVFQSDMNIFTRIRVLNAMQLWEDVTEVDFVERSSGQSDYIFIQDAADGAGSSSPVIGRGGSEQPLFIRQDLTGITDYGLAHELGHVLGFYHNHQRPDRANYVTVYDTGPNSRINDCKAGNFTIEPTALGFPRDVMDYDSVMTYGQCIFSNCALDFDPSCACDDDPAVCKRWSSQGACDDPGVTCCSEDLANCRVIAIKDLGDAILWQSSMGQRDHLSDLDVLVMSFMYPPDDWRFVEKNVAGSSENGSFHDPFLTFLTGLVWTPVDGTLWIQPGTYQEPPGIISKPMLIKAPLGNVLIR